MSETQLQMLITNNPTFQPQPSTTHQRHASTPRTRNISAQPQPSHSKSLAIEFQPTSNMKSKFSKYLGIPSGSTSGANPASGQSNVQPPAPPHQPEQSSGQKSQQTASTASTPPASTRKSRLWGKLRGSPSPSPAPPPSPTPSLAPGTQRRNSTTVHASQSLVVLASMPMRPHSSCSGTTTKQTQNPGSPSPTGIQSSSSVPPNVPSVRILHPPIASKGPISTSAPPLGSNIAIGSSSHSSQLWATTLQIAEGKLSENSLPPLDLSTLTSPLGEENIRVVVKKLATLQEENKEKQWSYNWRGKEVKVMERLGKILKIVDNYSKVVDTAVQSNPQVTALVWAGVRAIIQVALNHVEVIEGLEVALAALVEKVSICEFYAEMYYRVPLGSQSIIKLDSAIPELYAAVVVFTAKARGYFEAGGWKKSLITFKSFDIEFLPFIQEINAKEGVIRELADAATMERVRKMDVALQDITSELNEISINVSHLAQVTEQTRDNTEDVSNKVTHLVQVTERTRDDISNTLAHTTQVAEQTRDNTEHHRIVELLGMLTPLEPLKRHQDVKLPRSENAGTWLLRLESFRRWRDSQTLEEEGGHVFCCYGIPGAGKTVISSVVIDDLRSRCPNVACLYADYKDQNNQTLVNILGTFLRQFLATTQTPMPDEVTNKLHDIQREGGKVGFQDNLALLRIQLHHLKCAFICIDAIDELDPDVRWKLLKELKELDTENTRTRIFLTGREHVASEVQKQFQIPERNKVIISATRQDIEEFLNQKIQENRERDSAAMDDILAKAIVDTIIEKSQGMFLLPSLHIKMVLGMRTKAQRRRALETLPTDLYKSFGEIIARIREYPQGEAKLGMQVLMWLHFAYRPLELAELQHALAVEEGDAELDMDNIPSRKALLDCCLGLVIVDEETMTVRFVHYTLEEYFRENIENIWKEFPNGSSYIAETCLTYLNFGGLRQHCISIDSLEEKMEEYIFLKYSASYWGNHLKQQCSGVITKLADVIVYHESDCPPCAIQALYYELGNGFLVHWMLGLPWKIPIAKRFSGTHVMAYFGLSEYVSRFCRVGQYMDLKDDTGLTPLLWAAACGHESIVKMLITPDDVDSNVQVDINAVDQNGRTPILFAAARGHETVVRLLIKRDDDVINTKDKDGETPLSLAARRGHEALVRLLIECDGIDINAKGNTGKTPLSLAASFGHESIVRLLIGRGDIDINAEDQDGKTPLSWAAEEGYEAVVQLLIQRDDIDINVGDNDGQTPLSLAAQYGFDTVVQLLVEKGVDINAADKRGRTPFLLAAEGGYEAVVRLLIASCADINTTDEYGQTPFLLAAQEGHEAVVRLLIEQGVDINATGKHRQTPFSLAAERGHEAVMRLLTKRDDVDINATDIYGKTPFLLAASGGHEAVVRLLIEIDAVDINAADIYGQTPISSAATRGHDVVVRLLIEKGVDINAEDKHGQTPFSLAAEGGHEAVMRLLIGMGADINTVDEYGQTPFSLAANGGHEVVVRLLIGMGVDINAKDKNERTPLHLAATCGHEAVVRLLIESCVDINAKDKNGRTPFSLAARGGHEVVLQLLIEKSIDINTTDKYGQTALSLAAKEGCEAVVRLLIGMGVDINAKDKNERTPLSLAATCGHETVVRLLIESGVDINAKDKIEQTPLHLAATCGHEAVVRLLIKSDDVDINARDKNGQTALSLAAILGFEAVVPLLIGRDNVDINARYKDGRTLLSWVAEVGHEAIVCLLIERGDADINARAKDGRTPLSWAAWKGREAVVRLLTKRDDVDIKSRDKDGRTPLLLAAMGGHGGVLEELIVHSDPDINTKDNDGRTPLSWAAWKGREAVVRLLTKRDDVDIKSRDKDGRTPLLLAAMGGHGGVLEELIVHSDPEINTKDNDGWTPLSWAAWKGHEAVVSLLTKRDDVDINARDKHGTTPLLLAAANGREAVVRLLIESRGIDINARNNNGKSPLLLAAANGHEAVVRLLISDRGVDLNAQDNDGRTPLSWAAQARHKAIVKLLTDHARMRVGNVDAAPTGSLNQSSQQARRGGAGHGRRRPRIGPRARR